MPKDANQFKPVLPPPAPSAGKAALKAQVQQRRAENRAARTKTVTVTLYGAPVTLEMRKPQGHDNWRLQSKGFATVGDDRREMVPAAFWPELIACVFYVPGTEDRMWADDEIGEIGELDSDEVRALGDLALDFSSLSKEAADALAGNSDAATAASASTSPAS
jgi:hypothetical protein